MTASKRTCGFCGAVLPPHSTTPAAMAGRKFGKLTVLDMAPGVTPRKWLCNCLCGGRITVSGDALRRGLTRSCGCLRKGKREASDAATD